MANRQFDAHGHGGVTAFMRVTTNPKIFKQPDPLQDAMRIHVTALLSCPGVQFQACNQ